MGLKKNATTVGWAVALRIAGMACVATVASVACAVCPDDAWVIALVAIVGLIFS